jgi:hypothetical protein
MGVFLDQNGEEPLEDWPEEPGQYLRSPKRYLLSSDELEIRVHAPPGKGDGAYQVEITSETDSTGTTTGFTESTTTPGLYLSNDDITVGPETTFSVQVVEEELLTFTLTDSAGEDLCVLEIMVDAAEFSGCGVDRFYELEDQPVVVPASEGVGFTVIGDKSFINTIGNAVPNEMAQFILNAGLNDAEAAQSDLLHVSAHGSVDGSLWDHGLLSSGIPRAKIIDPGAGDAFAGNDALWNHDVEWAVLAACDALALPGRDLWALAIDGTPRNAHGILGASQPLVGPASNYQIFWDLLRAEVSFVDSYKLAMEDDRARLQPWAYRAYPDYLSDTVKNLGPELATSGSPDAFDSLLLQIAPECERAVVSPLDDEGGLSRDDLLTEEERLRPLINDPPVDSIMMERLRTSGVPLSQVERLCPLGGLVIAQVGPSHRDRISSLAAQQAFDLASGTLAAWGHPAFGRLRLQEIGTRISSNLEIGGTQESWTNGYVVRFQVLHQGVRVFGDRLNVRIVGDQVSGVSHFLSIPSNRSDVQRAAVSSPLIGLVDAWGAVEARVSELLGASAIRLREAELCYVAGSDLANRREEQWPHSETYTLAYRFRVVPLGENGEKLRSSFNFFVDPQMARIRGYSQW